MAELVFLPGAAGQASFWTPVAERLRDLGRAHLLGYPGFGALPPDPAVRSLADLHRWLRPRLPAGELAIVAQSMGGVLAVRLAVEEPARVTHLVLCATSGGIDVRRLGAAEWRDGYLADLPGAPRWFVDDRTDLAVRLGEVRAATLLLWSDQDPISPLPVGRFLAERIRGARLVTVPGGSHTFASERADEVAARIRDHLAGP